MATFVMMTKLNHGALSSPRSFQELSAQITARLRKDCPQVEWWSNYVLLGPYDYLDMFTAPDVEAAAKVAAIVRSYGHASTEIWPALEWEAFKAVVADMSEASASR
jgi:uncharacterized protein with GYD domain